MTLGETAFPPYVKHTADVQQQCYKALHYTFTIYQATNRKVTI